MKTCLKCGVERPEDQFPYRSRKTGKLKPNCRPCHNAEYRQYCKDNPEKKRASWKAYDSTPEAKAAKKRRTYAYRENKPEQYQKVRSAYYRKNIEKITRVNAEWRNKNPDRYSEINKNWRKRNMPTVLSWVIARHAQKLNATPKWANFEKIKKVYEQSQRIIDETGVPHAVDHIVPLKSKLVCGLHCEANLQVLSRSENLAKSNRWWPDMF